ncbi:Cysteine-rich receptor-like protein kinase 42 [Linum grandiflorum]
MKEMKAWTGATIFIALISFFQLTNAVSRMTESGLFCGTARPPPSAAASFIPSFVKEMESLSQIITTKKFATYHLNTTSISFYSLAQCHADLSRTDCLLCYAAARTKLPRCLPSVSARIYLDGCFLRYDNYSFYRESVSPSLDNFTCKGDPAVGADLGFAASVRYAVGNVTRKAAAGNGFFGVAEVGGVYALAQCWESVGRDGCRKCLAKAAAAVVQGCLPRTEGRGMNAGCFLKYSTQKLYSNRGDGLTRHGTSTLGVIVAAVLASAAFAMITFLAIYASYHRCLKAKQARKNMGKVSISFNKSGMSFKYETLEKATDYFSLSNKLGQGGAGTVYIGNLPNGQTVAVKRLIFNTRQWVDEFFNEVNLISGIQHKNLVKLVGCSIEGPESLLVYEYVCNKSLDHFLFDKNKDTMSTLNWKQRLNIIVGTAEGLRYLHGGDGVSPVRIIHRDIKSSNVLLDEDLNAKIADFGLVRHFGADKSHLSTGIAGTIGYMAPEYLVRGQLSEKADVYSFGVLVLEIVCGKRCNAVIGESNSLVQAVWLLYRTNRLVEAVDPSLEGNLAAEEAETVLRIGLLCAQASVSMRPSMKQVSEMLTSNECQIGAPSQPPFMRGADFDASFRSRSRYSYSVSNPESRKESSSLLSSLTSGGGPSRSEEVVEE